MGVWTLKYEVVVAPERLSNAVTTSRYSSESSSSISSHALTISSMSSL
jgi:hypothetical protein